MSFRSIICGFTCAFILASIPVTETDAQVGKIVKSMGNLFRKKAAKEVAEETAEQAFKAMTKDVAQKIVAKNASSSLVKTSSRVSNKVLKEAASTNIRKTFASKVGAEISQSSLKTAGRQFAKKIGKSVSREAQQHFVRRIGTETSQEMFEKSASASFRRSVNEYGIKRLEKKAACRLTGKVAMDALDDIPDIKKIVKELKKMSPDYFTDERFYVEQVGKSRRVGFKDTPSQIEVTSNGTIRATGGSTNKNGAVNEFLNYPLCNRKYHTEGGLLNFETDGLGRTTYVECHSSELVADMQMSNMARGGLPKGNMGSAEFNSGHLQQRSLGGLNEKINLLPMDAMENQHGRWAKLEMKERDAVKAGKDVWSRKRVSYDADGSISIRVDLTIDGKTKSVNFKNIGKISEI